MAKNADGSEMDQDELISTTGKPTVKPLEPPEPDEKDLELERTRVALKKANDEAKKFRLRNEQLEKAEEEKQTASLTEAERGRKEKADTERRALEAERRLADLEETNKKLLINQAIERYALGKFLYPDTVPDLVDRRRIEIDDDGNVVGVKEAVDKLLKERPLLAVAGKGGGTPPREETRRPISSSVPKPQSTVPNPTARKLPTSNTSRM